MDNWFFKQMKKIGREARRKNENYKNTFSRAESLAYKYWSLADRYHSDYIYIDEQIVAKDLKEVFEVYKKAGIFEIVIADDVFYKTDLRDIKCQVQEEWLLLKKMENYLSMEQLLIQQITEYLIIIITWNK